jgi:DnaJ-class molecular chaperone
MKNMKFSLQIATYINMSPKKNERREKTMSKKCSNCSGKGTVRKGSVGSIGHQTFRHTCSKCGGTGHHSSSLKTCPSCAGSGGGPGWKRGLSPRCNRCNGAGKTRK